MPDVSEPLHVIGMNDAVAETFRLHLFNRQIYVFERSSIGIERPSIGAVDDDQLRYDIGNAAKLVFILPAFLLCLFCCGDIYCGAQKFKVAR